MQWHAGVDVVTDDLPEIIGETLSRAADFSAATADMQRALIELQLILNRLTATLRIQPKPAVSAVHER